MTCCYSPSSACQGSDGDSKELHFEEDMGMIKSRTVQVLRMLRSWYCSIKRTMIMNEILVTKIKKLVR